MTAAISNPFGVAVFAVALCLVLGTCPVLWLRERRNR